MAEVQMQAPWVVYAKKVKALFEYDSDIIVSEPIELADEGAYNLEVRVSGDDKAESIAKVLPEDVEFGNIALHIMVIPDNDGKLTMLDHIRRAFAGNPALVDVMEVPVVPGGPSMAFALFAPEVVQIECDNAASPYGIVTTTYEDVARDVLNVDGVMIASEIED
jgi:hypothetical protein